MARLSIGQKSIVDITDGYTVNLIPTNGSYPTNASKVVTSTTTITINASGFQGSSEITSDLQVKIGGIIVNKMLNGATSTASGTTDYTITGVTTGATSGFYKFPLTLTIKADAQLDALVVTLPVYTEGAKTSSDDTDDIIIKSTFVASASPTGSQGTPGTSSYTWIRYAASDNPASMADTSTDMTNMTHIGIAKTSTNSEPTNVDAFSPWRRFVGTDGRNGTNGRDGLPGYTFILIPSQEVFRNNDGTATITLFIYKANMQHITKSAFQTEVNGTVKWFKGSVPSTGDTGKITDSIDDDGNSYIEVSAGTITDIENYFVIVDTN